jgi:hypothetical protein
MIEIKSHTLLAAYGEKAQNISVTEDTEAVPPRPGMRTFLVHPTNLTTADAFYKIELSSNQEGARVTNLSTGEDRVFMCANNRSAEELFGQSILPTADSYL